METTIPENAIPAADDRLVIRIREALRDRQAGLHAPGVAS